MTARLVCRYGPDRGAELTFDREAVVGRGGDSTLVLEAPEVSQRHARVWFDDERGGWFVEDLGSLNGTRLDGLRLTRPERLGRLHLLSFAEVSELFFVELAPGAAPAVQRPGASEEEIGTTRIDPEVPEVPPGLRPDAAAAEPEGTRIEKLAVGLPEALSGGPPEAGTRIEELPVGLPGRLAGKTAPGPQPPGPVLELLLEDGPRRFPLRPGEQLLGRSASAALRIRDRELSRRHATVRVEGGRVFLRDEGSQNGTWVDGARLEAEVEIGPATALRFGRFEARLVAAGEPGDG